MYSIGEFSNFTKTTIKTLRYYDEINLLKPTFIDSNTGFRYYDYIKFSELEKIQFFKDLDFPLKEIKSLINNSSLVDKSLRIKQEELVKQREELELKIKKIKMLSELNKKSPDPNFYLSNTFIEKQPEKYCISLEKNIFVHEIDDLIQELFSLIFAYKIKPKGNLIAHFKDKNNSNKQSIQVMFEVENFKEIPDEYLKLIPKGKYLTINFIGLYSNLFYAYERLLEEGNSPENYIFEEYLQGLVPKKLDESTYKVKPEKEKDPRQFMTKVFVKL